GAVLGEGVVLARGEALGAVAELVGERQARLLAEARRQGQAEAAVLLDERERLLEGVARDGLPAREAAREHESEDLLALVGAQVAQEEQPARRQRAGVGALRRVGEQ